jgi:MurNAc alpha-1-phosphate uridylyltransferase
MADLTSNTGRPLKAMIFAAGLGSRLKPWTDSHPKALAVVNGKSLLQRNVEYLQSFGIRELIVNVHHFADQVILAITNNKGWGSRISISDETDAVLETGGGLKKAHWFFGDSADFVVMNADILTDLDLGAMISQHQHLRPLATLAVSDRQTSRYFLFDDKGSLSGWRNTTTGEERISRQSGPYIPKAFSGIHIISSSIFGLIRQEGKFSMVDTYLDLAQANTIQAYDHTGARLVDVGKPESIAHAEQFFR